MRLVLERKSAFPMSRIVLGVFALFGALVMIRELPSLRRYLRIERM